MNIIPLSVEETEAAIAREILQVIIITKTRIAALRKDQAEIPAREIKNGAGVVVTTIPARSAVTLAGIEAKLGKENVELLDQLNALVSA